MDRDETAPPTHHGPAATGPAPAPPDTVLLAQVRDPDPAAAAAAFDALYRRHAAAALRHARHWARTEAAAEDLRAEAFTRVLEAIRAGTGPSQALLPYLLTTMRRVAAHWAEGERRTRPVADPADLERPEPPADPVLAALERALAGLAFGALPERWRTVLWHTEVEHESPAQLTELLGIDAGAVAALAYRAREGLKQAYLQAHITEIGDPACRPYAARLGTHARGRLARRERERVAAHLTHCADCTELFAMLKHINANLGALAGPAVLGAAAAAGAWELTAVPPGAAAPGSTAAAGHTGLGARAGARLRRTSPRRQALAVITALLVLLGAIAFAMTGTTTGPTKATPTPAPAPRRAPNPPPPTTPAPTSPAPTHSAPGAAPFPAAYRPSPARPPRPAPATSPPTPGPAPSTAPPTTPPPTPTPTPARVICPAAARRFSTAAPRHTTITIGFLDIRLVIDLPPLGPAPGPPPARFAAPPGTPCNPDTWPGP